MTEGKPKLTDAVAAKGATDDELLTVALAVEEHSDHPLASAIVKGARERLSAGAGTLTASDVKSITGRGVQAQVDGDTRSTSASRCCSQELPDSAMPSDVENASADLVASGRTTMVVRKGARFLGVIGVMDTPGRIAGKVMAQLRELGIERLIMISGDNQQVANAVAKSVGLTEARGNRLMPEQKVDAIKDLRSAHGKVAMVGDGSTTPRPWPMQPWAYSSRAQLDRTSRWRRPDVAHSWRTTLLNRFRSDFHAARVV